MSFTHEQFSVISLLSSWAVYMSFLVFSIHTNPWHMTFGIWVTHFLLCVCNTCTLCCQYNTNSDHILLLQYAMLCFRKIFAKEVIFLCLLVIGWLKQKKFGSCTDVGCSYSHQPTHVACVQLSPSKKERHQGKWCSTLSLTSLYIYKVDSESLGLSGKFLLELKKNLVYADASLPQSRLCGDTFCFFPLVLSSCFVKILIHSLKEWKVFITKIFFDICRRFGLHAQHLKLYRYNSDIYESQQHWHYPPVSSGQLCEW